MGVNRTVPLSAAGRDGATEAQKYSEYKMGKLGFLRVARSMSLEFLFMPSV